MVENKNIYNEGELAKLCREALEKSFGMDIPLPEISVRKNQAPHYCRNPLVKVQAHWSSVI